MLISRHICAECNETANLRGICPFGCELMCLSLCEFGVSLKRKQLSSADFLSLGWTFTGGPTKQQQIMISKISYKVTQILLILYGLIDLLLTYWLTFKFMQAEHSSRMYTELPISRCEIGNCPTVWTIPVLSEQNIAFCGPNIVLMGLRESSQIGQLRELLMPEFSRNVVVL